MATYLARRVAIGILVVLGATVLVFLATTWLPGDAVRARLPLTATGEQIAAERARLGLDRPAVTQYLEWLGGAVRGDLGDSWASGMPVRGLIGPALGNSAALLAATLAVVVPVSLTLAVAAGLRPGGLIDRVVLAVSMAAVTIPPFVVGSVAVLLLAVRLRWFPAVSSPDPARPVLAQPALLTLPVSVLAVSAVGYLTQVTRAQVVTVARSEHVEWTRLRGVPAWRLLGFHLLPGLAPIAGQTVALSVVSLLTGGVVVEILFAYPGLGMLLQSATATRDLPLVQGIALLAAVMVVVANLVSELLTWLLVPRLRGRQDR